MDCEIAQHQLQHDYEAEEAEPTEPITCCGEWTWDGGEEVWRQANSSCKLDLTPRWTELVCFKCHRALLEDGQMTEPLVELAAIRKQVREWEQEIQVFNPLIHLGVAQHQMLKETWGEQA